MKKPLKTIPSTAMEALVRYDWPGNIRELQNFIERAVILSSDEVLRPPLSELTNPAKLTPHENGNGNSLQHAEREHIVRVLKDADWVLGGDQGAAAKLGIPSTTLIYKTRRIGLPCYPVEAPTCGPGKESQTWKDRTGSPEFAIAWA